jgi:hypothetical protein
MARPTSGLHADESAKLSQANRIESPLELMTTSINRFFRRNYNILNNDSIDSHRAIISKTVGRSSAPEYLALRGIQAWVDPDRR